MTMNKIQPVKLQDIKLDEVAHMNALKIKIIGCKHRYSTF
jgi:hypothetical protein